MFVKIELAKNLNKRIKSYTGIKKFQKLYIKDSFKNGSEISRQI